MGGNVYLIADKSMTSFNFETHHFNAGNGSHGGSAGMTGRRGSDVYISVPIGTVITDKDMLPLDDIDEPLQGYDDSEVDSSFSIDLNDDKMKVLVAKGGMFGIGNKRYAGTGTQKKRSVPRTKMPGQPGQKRSLKLELKLIADVGLVGFPNVMILKLCFSDFVNNTNPILLVRLESHHYCVLFLTLLPK
jgi:GTP-binding protein